VLRRGGVLIVAILAACSAAQTSPSPTGPVTPPQSVPTTPGASTAPAASGTASPVGSPSATPTASLSGPRYKNPVFADDFPDPHLLRVDDTYYGYATNTGGQNLPVIRSADLVTWERVHDGMPALPAWAKPNFGNTWAPGVIQIGDRFVLYYVARDKVSDRQCIGVATSAAPEGSFTDPSAEPFICQRDLGGSIDPYPYLDADGQLYIYWKNDGNCCAKPVDLWVQRLAADGLGLEGDGVALIRRDQAWEIPLIENPAMTRHDDAYYLFYSANWWESANYAVGYAKCETATGPCVKPQDGPIYESAGDALGPGGEAFLTDADGNVWMSYHAWTRGKVGYPVGKRSLRIDPVAFDADGKPAITGPTTDPQLLP
jgi:beta-xylosidase